MRFLVANALPLSLLRLAFLTPLFCFADVILGETATRAVEIKSAAETVSAVEIRLDQSIGAGVELERFLAFAPGDRLSEEAVRRTISNFHASGHFEEVEIHRRSEPEGLVVDVVLRSHTWVDRLEIEGNLGLRRELLLRRIEQKAETPLVEDRLLRSVYALQDLYEENGYRRASVKLHVVPRDQEKLLGVIFHVDSGPRAVVGEIEFEGELAPYDAAKLRDLLGLERGSPYDGAKVVEQIDRLRAALVRDGYLKSTVRKPRALYQATGQEMHLVFPIEVGPVVRVEVMGADLDQLRRKELLPFLDDQVYDEALVKKSADAIKAFYQRKGHYLAAVTTQESEEGGRIELSIHIDPGPVFSLEEIRFTGNRSIPDRELRQLMATAPQTALAGGRLVSDVLREDLANLQSFYALQGFDQAEIGPARIDFVREALVLTIPIAEGRRRRVVNLRLPGVEGLDPERIRNRLPLRRGGPFHAVLLEESVNMLRALYEEEGFADALIAPQLDWNNDKTLVDIDLEVQEGRRSVVDRVILRGHRKTRPEILYRFAGLAEGDPISRRSLLQAERELYRLGIFSRVDVDMAPLSDPSGRRDVVIRLDEGRRWRLAYGVSYHSDDGPGGLLSLSRVNIGGRGDRLQVDVRANERDRRFRLIFDQPSLGGWNFPMTYTLFRQDEERESFTVEDTGVQAALTKDFSWLRLGLTYDYRLVNLVETRIDPQNIDREDRELEISSLTPNLFLDRRDDPLDPSRGFLTSVQLEYAFPFIRATANFAKFFVQQTQYASLGRFGVIAGSLRLGAIEPLDDEAERDPLVPPELASSLIPVSERFFAGGRTTHRAYERDKLGVPGETLLEIEGGIFESGGNGLALLNLDYRFPIAGRFGGTVFFDLGNVWADWRDFDARDLKPGAGVGVRYQSPIGPVRFEIGWKLDLEPGEDPDPVFFLSLGNPF